MFIKRMILATACFGFFSAAIGAELLLTDDGMAKSRSAASTIALDIVSDGDVSAFDMIIPVPKGVKVNTSRCLTALPTGFEGSCKHNEGEIAIIAVSMGSKVLPAGIFSVGTLTISGGSLPSTTAVKFNAVGVDAKSLDSQVRASIAPSVRTERK